jgi:hypothetical protein
VTSELTLYAVWHQHTYETKAHCTSNVTVACTDANCPVETDRTKTLKAEGHKWDDNGNCTNPGCTETKSSAMKFDLSVTSGASVTATVYDDYSLVVELPTKGATVSTSGVDLTVTMQNVESLNVKGTKSHPFHVNTADALGNSNTTLSSHLSNCYSFKSATVAVTIGKASCTYEFAGAANADTSYTITATPQDIGAARDAWAALTDKANISVTEQNKSDSYILIANGSTLTAGNKLLKFEDKYTEQFLKVDGFNDLSALNERIRKAVELTTPDSALTNGITGLLNSGSALAIGDDVATLDKSAVIAISGIQTSNLETGLTDLQQAKSATTTVKALVNLFDALVGAVNGNSNLKVEIDFF